MYRPAGFSDEEDEEDFEFSIEYDDNPKRVTYLDEKAESKENIFYKAVKDGDIYTMKTMLKEGFYIDQPLSGGWSALMYACSFGLWPVIEFLIAEGANVNFSKELFTPLMALCRSSSVKEEELVKAMDLLLAHGVNINATDRNASTALMFASMSCHAQLVRKLVDCKCDLNIQDTEGWSALFHAVNEGHEEIVKILVEGKARLDLIDRRRRTAFELGMLKEFEHLAKLVCSKREKRKYFEVEEDIDLSKKKMKDPVEILMAQLPSTNAKSISGFSSDVSKLLYAMGVGHLSKQFMYKNVQLNELLLITDEHLKELGVRFSVHRQRILTSIRKFHLHPWNKASLGLKPRNQQMDIEDGIKLMSNVIKHLHVLNATVNYVKIQQPIPIQADVLKKCENAIHQLDLIGGELSNIQLFASDLKVKEIIKSVDLIGPKKSNKNYFCSIFLTTVLIGVVMWKNKLLIYFPAFNAFNIK